ncbi:MAG: hypothetical protein L3J78_02920 [Thermoplasmata archaeon]|nr:hypothetical protein [Thermoplasmata archaeon]
MDRGIVIDVGPGSADSVYARFPSVLRDANGTYQMWYSGFDGFRNRILYASSIDGITWTKRGVVIDVGQSPWYFDSVAAQSVLKLGGTYHMWLAGGYWNVAPAGSVPIYHATSPDGMAWTVQGIALPHGTSGSWDSVSAHFPAVVQNSDGTFRLYFSGWDGSKYGIGVARSATFENFTEDAGNPILPSGTTGSFDTSWMAPNTVLRGGIWTMYYSGSNGSASAVGIATSSDGRNWTKYGANPILTAGPPAIPGSISTDYAAYLADPAGNRIYYDSWNGRNARIGLLTAAPASGSTVSYSDWTPIVIVAIAGGGAIGLGVGGWLGLRRPSGRPPR